jgi:hypothetical protein
MANLVLLYFYSLLDKEVVLAEVADFLGLFILAQLAL